MELSTQYAKDPASNRLRPDQVIAIHKAHQAGQAWDRIAAANGTNRKMVQRIVQGRRHPKLHPEVAPGLYAAQDEPLTLYTRDDIEEAAHAALDTFLSSLTAGSARK